MNFKKLEILINIYVHVTLLNFADSFNLENNKLAFNMPLHQTTIVSLLDEQYFFKHKIFLEFLFEVEIC